VTAVGKTEWADIKWNDQSIADKKNIINGAELVFTASETVQHWEKAHRALHDGGVNAHFLIAATPTLSGLLQGTRIA
jgi:hypothetical protein